MRFLTLNKYFPLLLLTSCLLSACAESSTDFVAKPFTLDNGARLIVIPDRRFPLITQMIWFPVGSGDEVAPKTGLAHFLEHLMFQHQTYLAQGGFLSIIEAEGARSNAFTSYDYTAYYERFHPKQIEKMMALEAQRLTTLVLNKQTISKERNVVIEEFHTRLNTNPLSLLQAKMSAALYGKNHPYGRDIIGELADIETLTQQDAYQFYKLHYTPARAIIIIAGDIEPAHAFALAQKHYGTIAHKQKNHRATEAKDFPFVLQRQSEKAIITHQDKRVRQALLLRDYTVTNRHILGARSAAHFEVLAQVLVGSPQAKLNTLFIDQEKIASFVGGGLALSRRGPAEFSIQIWLKQTQALTPSNLKAIYQRLDQTLHDIANQKRTISRQEVEAAKNRLLAQKIYLKDNQYRLANFVGHWLATGHALEAAQSYSSYIQAVHVNDVRQAAATMLSPDRAVSGFLLPKSKSNRR